MCEVEYLEITKSTKKMRAPSFKGLRDDKSPEECVLELLAEDRREADDEVAPFDLQPRRICRRLADRDDVVGHDRPPEPTELELADRLHLHSIFHIGIQTLLDQDLRYDVGNARIWGGIHFRSAVEDGITIGKKTVDYVLAHNFQRSAQ